MWNPRLVKEYTRELHFRQCYWPTLLRPSEIPHFEMLTIFVSFYLSDCLSVLFVAFQQVRLYVTLAAYRNNNNFLRTFIRRDAQLNVYINVHSNLILFIACVQSHKPTMHTIALQTAYVLTTAVCFGAGAPSSESLKCKVAQANMNIN
jgi:hypothetical protein